MVKNILLNLQRKYSLKLPLVTFSAVFVLVFLIIWCILARFYGMNMLKKEFGRTIEFLNQAGYDIAYDDIDFSAISPFKIMEIKNFQIYKIEKNKRWAWKVPSLSVNANLLKYKSLNLYISEQQSLILGSDEIKIKVPEFSCRINFDGDGLYNLLLNSANIQFDNHTNIKNLKWAVQKNDTGIYEAKFDTRHIRLFENRFDAMGAEIEEIYADVSLVENFEDKGRFYDSILDWRDKGGKIIVNRFILNWQPLVLVGKGDVSFDDNLEVKLSLNTTSKGFEQTLENLGNAGIFDSKSTFVAKVLVDTKNKQNNIDDAQADTFSVPMSWDKKQFFIENISMLPK